MTFNEIKPFLMAGFKVDCGADYSSAWFLEEPGKDKLRYIEYPSSFSKGSIHDSSYSTIDSLEENYRKFDDWRVIDIPDVKKLTSEQAVKLMDAGYKVTNEVIREYEGFYFKKSKGGEIFYEKPNVSHKALFFSCYSSFELYDNEPFVDGESKQTDDISVPTKNKQAQENPMGTFDFAQAVKHMKDGKKVKHDRCLEKYFVFDGYEFRDQDECLVDFDADEIIRGSWSLYEESRKHDKIKVGIVDNSKNQHGVVSLELKHKGVVELELKHNKYDGNHEDDVSLCLRRGTRLLMFEENAFTDSKPKFVINKRMIERLGFDVVIE